MSSLKSLLQTRDINELIPIVENHHLYTSQQRLMVKRMLHKHRQFSPVIIDPQGNILSGYLIYWGMKKLGLKTVTIIELS